MNIEGSANCDDEDDCRSGSGSGFEALPTVSNVKNRDIPGIPGSTDCIAWRQTGKCDPDGPREKTNDKNCMVLIHDAWSGYCECSDGIKRMRKGCKKGRYKTCYAACWHGE